MLTTLCSLSANIALFSAHVKHLDWIIFTTITIGFIIIGILVTIK